MKTVDQANKDLAMVPAETEEKALVPAEAHEQFESGLEALDAGDLVIPRLTVTQGQTPDIEQTQVGKLRVNVTGDFSDELNLAIIKLGKSRVLMPEDYDRENKPLCKSYDFKVPVTDVDGMVPMCDTCGLIPGDKKKHFCEYANWTANSKGKSVPPRCQETWDMLVVDLDTYMPMWWSLKSSALSPLRKIISAISMIGNAKRIPMWGQGFNVTLELAPSSSGTFYLPVFSGRFNLEQDDLENMTAIRAQLVDASIQESTEEMEQDVPVSAPKDDDEF